MPSVDDSVRTDAAESRWNAVDPSRQQTMKDEKMVPKGTLAPSPKAAPTARDIAGGHWSTKMYIAPSKSACAAPTRRIFRSAQATSKASRIVGAPRDPSADAATFSVQSSDAASAPRPRKPTLSSKGPVGPRAAAARDASWPATMATIASPA